MPSARALPAKPPRSAQPIPTTSDPKPISSATSLDPATHFGAETGVGFTREKPAWWTWRVKFRDSGSAGKSRVNRLSNVRSNVTRKSHGQMARRIATGSWKLYQSIQPTPPLLPIPCHHGPRNHQLAESAVREITRVRSVAHRRRSLGSQSSSERNPFARRWSSGIGCERPCHSLWHGRFAGPNHHRHTQTGCRCECASCLCQARWSR